jgi:hypothetical protein
MALAWQRKLIQGKAAPLDIDITAVYRAFIFVPLKEAKNIAPGVNPGDSIPVPTSSEGAAQMRSIPQIFWIIIDAMFVLPLLRS